MDKPKCKLCGKRHSGLCAAIWNIPPSQAAFDRVAYQREYMRRWRAAHKNEKATALYRHFDAAGALLYVGVSVHPETRNKQHSYSAAWWPEVAKTETVYFSTLPEALAAESAAVASETPRHNKHLTQQLIAPPGQCASCDVRRENNAVHQRRFRAKRLD